MKAIINNLLGDKSFSEILSGSGLVLIFKMIGMMAGYVFVSLITNLLGAESFGIYTICFTILSISIAVAKLGLDNASVKSISAYVSESNPGKALLYFRKSYLAVFIAALVIGGGLFLSANWIAEIFDNPSLATGIKITGFILIPNSLMHMHAEKYRGLKKMAWYSLLINGSISLISALILFILFQLYGNITELSLFALCTSVTALWLFASFKREFNVTPAPWSSIDYPSMLRVSIPMLLSGSMFLIMSWTDVLLLGYYLDETQVAIYNIAFKISALVTLVLYAINAIASPKFASLFALDKKEELRHLALQIAKLNFFLTIPATIGILVLSGFILNFFGEEFIAGQISLILLCIGQFFSAVCGSVLTLLNMAGREKTVRNIVGGTALLNLGLNAVLIQLYGIEGAALATSISLVVWNLLGVMAVKKYFGFIMLPFVK